MKSRIIVLSWAFALGVGSNVLAQENGRPEGLSVAEQRAVKKKDPNGQAKEYMKIANQKAKEARKAAEHGDNEEVEEAMKGHEAAMKGAMDAIEQGKAQGRDMTAAWEAVDRGTAKHGQVLADVLTRVPNEAKPGIERAIEGSQHGRVTALEAIEKARKERVARGEGGFRGPERVGARRGGAPDVFEREDRRVGPPAGAGAGRTTGGPPSGAGPGRAGRGGRP